MKEAQARHSLNMMNILRAMEDQREAALKSITSVTKLFASVRTNRKAYEDIVDDILANFSDAIGHGDPTLVKNAHEALARFLWAVGQGSGIILTAYFDDLTRQFIVAYGSAISKFNQEISAINAEITIDIGEAMAQPRAPRLHREPKKEEEQEAKPFGG